MDSRIRDAFGSVHAEEALKQRTKAYLVETIRGAQNRKPALTGRIAATLACLVLLLVGGYRFYVTPVSLISVDVNPSIELGVNRFDRVVSVQGYNEDGSALAVCVDIRNMDYSNALGALLASEAMTPYLENDALVSIAVIGSTDAKSEEMLSSISACDYAASPNIACRRGNREEVQAAHDAGLSFGKYRAFLELQALDPGVTAADVQGLTMRQIRDRIDALSGAESPPHGMGFGRGNGGGNGRGRGAGKGAGNARGEGKNSV